MQIHSEDLVEVTWMWDRSGLRRVAWTGKSSRNRTAVLVALVSLTVAVWAFDLWGKLGGPYPFAAVWLSVLGAGLVAQVCLTAWLRLRKTPDFWYAPMTVRIDADGVRLTQASGEFFHRWALMSPVVRTKDDWHFTVRSVGGIIVPRGLISPADDAAIAVVVDRYAHLVGRPADLPPPAEV
ncbi:YcxB family protein [Catellatospora coxensis]|uniref:YcxB-like protein n=1 Tax=Catellatospora coxensis TaxID=310354 RepID=A0A8J3PC00_9ACTN|nr:YcxB family protein [Catellatospora coxensis]GIG11119.1 hypothetical protein Cco03nite_78190 [Catellatospora coxensis]